MNMHTPPPKAEERYQIAGVNNMVAREVRDLLAQANLPEDEVETRVARCNKLFAKGSIAVLGRTNSITRAGLESIYPWFKNPKENCKGEFPSDVKCVVVALEKVIAKPVWITPKVVEPRDPESSHRTGRGSGIRSTYSELVRVPGSRTGRQIL